MFRRYEFVFGWVSGLIIALCTGGIGWSQESSPFSQAQRNHWAFVPVTQKTVPDIKTGTALSQFNPLDSFIVAELNSSGHSLSEPADIRTLLRRITFDLIGLPPTPDEIDDFLQDDSPDAYEKVVDRLLSSPHYGEAWGRNWLDVVRFAETAGFKEDPIRPNAFTYRDYVIRAFNRDLPFDRFITDQLAGDELFPDDADSLAATAYCRMWPDESNASDILRARQTSLDDLTANVGSAFLGLSIGCAQCHDHKFDPILQTDFYQLQAFFSGIVLEEKVPVGTNMQLSEFRQAEQAWLVETAEIRRELNRLEHPARVKMQGDKRMKFPAEVLEALDTPIEDRTTMQRQLAFWSARQMGVKEEDIPKHLDDGTKSRRETLLQSMAEAKARRPRPTQEANVMAVVELTTVPPITHRMENGSYDQPREEVVPHFPAVLRRLDMHHPPAITPPSNRSSGRRSELARWLASPDNPLTHRVWVNRIWQGHFGLGLVSNANDFGTQTPNPTHQNLFDWLTNEFISQSFQSKRLHRQIVTSGTYRQMSDAKPVSPEGDVAPVETVENTPAYAHFPRQRLSSERIRDALLMASGQFNDSMYGPGIRPELPPNFSSYEWKNSDLSQQVRRSIYIFAKRNLPYPLMTAFDFPDMHESCGCRTKTTIAPQALMLLNSQVILQAAAKLANRSRKEATSADPAEQIRLAWRIVFGRPANDREIETALRFVDDQHRLIANSETTSSAGSPESTNPNHEAFADLCHALLNANEFLFVE